MVCSQASSDVQGRQLSRRSLRPQVITSLGNIMRATIACLLCSVYTFADPVPPQWGAETDGGWFYVPGGSEYDYHFDGGAGTTLATTTIDNEVGVGKSLSLLRGENRLPILKAQSATSPTAAATQELFNSAWAIEGFRYSGATPTQLTYNVSLTGSVSDPAANDTGIYSVTAFLDGPGFGYDVNYHSLFINEVLLASPLFLDFNDTVNNGSKVGSLSINVVPGQVFYLYQLLATTAQGPNAAADAYGTLKGSFADDAQVQVMSVPEPAAGLLAFCGMVALSVARRCSRRARIGSGL